MFFILTKGLDMERKPKKISTELDSNIIKRIDRLIEVNENSMIIDLVLRGVPQQEIRKIVQCKMGRITRLLKPVNAYAKKFLKEQKKKNL